MNKINLVYVDDDRDQNISIYLAEEYCYPKYDICYEEISFDNRKGYESLINDSRIKEANIILIDSKLFENGRVSGGKFTGEEFKIILKKTLPFIEVIVITQNEIEKDYGILLKYRENKSQEPNQYYAGKLKKALNQAVENVCIYRNISEKLKKNEDIDKMLVERIINSLDGYSLYEELTVKDIDEIITVFKELQRNQNG